MDQAEADTRRAEKFYQSHEELPEKEKEEYLAKKKSIDKGMNLLCFVLILISIGISALIAFAGNGHGGYGDYMTVRLVTLFVALIIWGIVRSSKMGKLREEFNIKK